MNELVINQNGKPVTNSMLIAQKFCKQHKHVIASIKNLFTTAENSAVLEMFSESTYLNDQEKPQPYFIINRDGFSLLVMGFTGKEALKFKIEFIKAFNQMEEQLKQDRRALIPSDDVCLRHLKSIINFGYVCKKDLEYPMTIEQRMHTFTRFLNFVGYECSGLQTELDKYYQNPQAMEYYLNNSYNPFAKKVKEPQQTSDLTFDQELEAMQKAARQFQIETDILMNNVNQENN